MAPWLKAFAAKLDDQGRWVPEIYMVTKETRILQ